MLVNICIVGAAGVIGLRHTEHCLENTDVNISCIIDPTPAGLIHANKHQLKLYSSVDAMLAARAAREVVVDGVILATPNSSHVPLAKQMLRAEIHVLLEKPMSTDILSGRDLVATSYLSKSKLLIGHHRRFNPYIQNLKSIVDSGKLGIILAVQGQWTVKKPDAYYEVPTEWRKDSSLGGGPALINLVHDIDLCRFLLGDITRVYCEAGISTRGNPVEETGCCTLKFSSGVIGTFVFSDAATSPYHFESSVGENPLMPLRSQNVYTFIGTKASVAFPENRPWYYEQDNGAWSDSLIQSEPPNIKSTPPFTTQLQHFVKVCRGELEPLCNGADALKTILTIECIKESISTGLPVTVPSS